MHATRDQLISIDENLYLGFASEYVERPEDFNYSTVTTDIGNGNNFELVDIIRGRFVTRLIYKQKDSSLKLVIYKG